MSNHYESAKPASESVFTFGKYFYASLSILFLVLAIVVACVAKTADDNSMNKFMISAILSLPFFLQSLLCFTSYRLAKSKSFYFYVCAASALLFPVLGFLFFVNLIKSVTPA